MTSSDIRTKIKLRRTSRPISPSENKVPASISPSLMGICVMLNLRILGFAVAEVISADQAGQQEHGTEFHSNHIGSEQRYRHFLRSRCARAQARGAASRQIDNFYQQDAG